MANHVVIPELDEPITYTVGGTPQSEFAIPFPFFAASDIVVHVDGEAVAAADFTVTGLFVQNGDPVEGAFGSGTVTLDTPVSNVDVTLDRFIGGTREDDFSSTAPLPARAVNSALDKLTARDQDLLRRYITGAAGVETARAAAEAAETGAEAAKEAAEDAVLSAPRIVGTLAALEALTDTSRGNVSALGRTATGDGYEGGFGWLSGDQSAAVTVDTKKAIFVPPTGSNGSTGAWRRIFSGGVDVRWFGFTTSASDPGETVKTANVEAVQKAILFATRYELNQIIVPAGSAWFNDKIVVEMATSDAQYSRTLYIVGQGQWTAESTGSVWQYNGADTAGLLQIKSAYSVYIQGICFRTRTNGHSQTVLIEAGEYSPPTLNGYSSSQITFVDCQFLPGGANSLSKALVWIVDTTIVTFERCNFGGGAVRGNALYLGDTEGVRTTLLGGLVENVSLIGCALVNGHNMIACNQIKALNLKNCKGGESGGMRIYPVGSERMNRLYAESCSWVDEDPDNYPAVTQSSTYAPTASGKEPTSGMTFASCGFRDRPVAVKIGRGWAHFVGGTMLVRNSGDIGVVIDSTCIGPVTGLASIDFTKAYSLGNVAIDDNRTEAAPYEFFVAAAHVAASGTITTLARSGNINAISLTASRPLRGGYYRIFGRVAGSAGNATQRFMSNVKVNGTAVTENIRHSPQASSPIVLVFDHIVRLEATTTAPTIDLYVEEQTGAGATDPAIAGLSTGGSANAGGVTRLYIQEL
jgi:hypothetical protein